MDNLKCTCDEKKLPCPIHGDITYDEKLKQRQLEKKIINVCLCDCECSSCGVNHIVSFLTNDVPIKIYYFNKDGERVEATITKTLKPYED